MTAAIEYELDPIDFIAAHRRAAAAERRIFAEVFKARERMTLREWADSRRWLSQEANALAADAKAPVRYSSSLTPYHRAIMDALSDPRTEIVTWKASSQDGKTEIVNNFIGWKIDVDPGPMLVLQPTLEMAQTWSKDRLAPMLRDTPSLRGKVRDARSRDADNTMLHKKFPGGHLTIVGSNSAAGVSARPIRDVVTDEADRLAKSAGTEGAPLRLGERRAVTFRRGKKFRVSSPTIKDDSLIDAEYNLGTQEEFEVPCPHCGEYQTLVWGAKLTYGLKWEKDAKGDPRPETAHYVCRATGCVIEEYQKAWMIERHRWVARAPENGPRHRSFTKNLIGSNLVAWRKLVAEWKDVQGKVGELQTFINTVLCELWDPLSGKSIKLDDLLDRRGVGYPETDDPNARTVPDGVAYLTRSVDTQDDRLETAVWGWGEKDESWCIDWELLPGDPAKLGPDSDGNPSPWQLLDKSIDRTYRTESGAEVRPIATFIDSGGHHSAEVYKFTRSRQMRRVFAIKGANTEGAPLLAKPTRNNSARALLYMVGSFSGKEVLVNRLARVTAPGPGYVHLPAWLDGEQVAQLTRLRLVTPVNKGGRKWVKPKREWQETGAVEFPILYVYAYIALQLVGPRALARLGEIAKEQAEEARAAALKEPEKPIDPDDDPNPPTPIGKKKRGGWATGNGQWGLK